MTARFRRVRLPRPRSLGGKLIWMLSAAGVIGAVAIMVMLAAVITPSFDRLEEQAVQGHVERTRAALREFAGKVESASRDYGDWNDSYAYMAAPSAAFERDSFSVLAMANLGMDGMAYVAPDRRIVIARWVDQAAGRDVPAMRAQLVKAIGGIDLDAQLGPRSSASFYIRLGDRLSAIGVARVRRSDGSGDPRGFVLMARAMSSKQLAALVQLPAVIRSDTQGTAWRMTTRPRTLSIAVPIAGADGRPVADAAFTVPRDLTLLGRQMLWLAVGGTVLLLALMLLVLTRIVARLVLRPLARIERHMHDVRASGTMRVLREERRDDEIGSLVTSFNAMLRQLNDLSEQLEAQSFRLGRSESAVAVMHNVRNALSPISTILSHGLIQPPVADRALLDRAVAELANDDVVPARRRKLAGFITAATQAASAARIERMAQLEIGRAALHNVLDIIGEQQQAAHERPPLDPCDVTDIVARNAAIARYSGEHSIAFSFPAQPYWVLANRVILSQVIGNLFGNAAESIAARIGAGGQITVTIAEAQHDVTVTISDDGEGFDPATAALLFQRGYSTRSHKSGGLGLHWCANSMVAMGGALRLESEGPGCGAHAVLTLQAAEAMQASAAA
ncbi:histidine kinase [Sphingomonas sp. Leaf407]|uniref:CHASE4 domain-containing protein n=1 Tax=unclassified Sphingomonas TaxID=196159 RepID=UPI0006F6ED33|nr:MULTISPECIES: CHASE4 domain-containing protein [unclassified Sphingomonas]KQN36517.1 histidine kinase [Sphingomonas sp. Leaf42]KQT27138.1 histidine kinase [Sphingomonas sp. Leaf407]